MTNITKLPKLTPIVPDDPTADTIARADTTTFEPEPPRASTTLAAVPTSPGADLAAVDTWSGVTVANTYKLPPELLKELDRRVTELKVTKTATLAAALLEFLSYGDEELLQRTDAFAERLDRARRRARRSG